MKDEHGRHDKGVAAHNNVLIVDEMLHLPLGSSQLLSPRLSEGPDLLWLRVPMRVSDPQWVADQLSPYSKSNQGRLSVVASTVDLSVPLFIGDLIDAVAAGRDQWVHLDLTLRYIQELGWKK